MWPHSQRLFFVGPIRQWSPVADPVPPSIFQRVPDIPITLDGTDNFAATFLSVSPVVPKEFVVGSVVLHVLGVIVVVVDGVVVEIP